MEDMREKVVRTKSEGDKKGETANDHKGKETMD
jgi:hypothetical protein